MTYLLTLSFAAYAITFVVASSSIFDPFRWWFKRKFPWLQFGQRKHMIDCRMCVGFYASVLVCAVTDSWLLTLPVYGLSYFLATQERS